MPRFLIVALALVTIAIVVGALFARECRAATAEADRQTEFLLQALGRADYEAAFSLFCTDGLSSTDAEAAYEDFRTTFELLLPFFEGYVRHSTSGSGLTVSTEGEQFDYEAEVTFSDGSVGQFVAVFLKKHGNWCLQEFDLTGRPVTAPQPVSTAGATPTATTVGSPSSPLTEVILPLLREYVHAVSRTSEASLGASTTYEQAVENRQLQAAFDEAFRKAQDILRASIINSPDERDCVNALREWSRFATDYWNSLARASIDRVPSRWSYALRFEGEVHFQQGRVTSECPALIAGLGTSLPPPSTTEVTALRWRAP